MFRPNQNITKTAALVVAVIWLVLFLISWSFGSAFLIPGPLEVMRAWIRMVQEEGLIGELWVSFLTNLHAILLSILISVGLAYLTVLPVMRTPVAFLSKCRFLGLTGLVVAFTTMFGGGHTLKVALMTFGMSTFFLTSMAAVVESVPKAEFDHARSLRMGRWRTVWEVVVLGRIDETVEALRQNAAIGWVMLTMVEGLVRSEGGVGALMLNQSKHFKLDAVFAVVFTVGLVGACQDWSLAWLKNLCCPYAGLTLERSDAKK